MPLQRRPTDRRRRVLYSAHQAQHSPRTTNTRSEVQRLRAARRPTAIYGERVQRRLDARWFSLVPVQQRTFHLVAIGLAVIVGGLCLLHYLSVAWQTLAYQVELARPLRLDHSDSIGRWVHSLLLMAISGVALLIYQLRRYRLDDYQGRYRLWRTVLVASLICSLGVSISIIQWLGAGIDAIVGKRVALSGADWLRLLISTGAMVMILRLIAEVHRSRLSLALIVLTAGCIAVPQAVHWHLFDVSGPATWSLVTAAPLMGTAAFFLSLGSYLRLIYREVCEVEDGPSLRERMVQLRARMFQRDDMLPSDKQKAGQTKFQKTNQEDKPELASNIENETGQSSPRKRRWWNRKSKTQTVSVDHEEEAKYEAAPSPNESSSDSSAGDVDSTDSSDATPTPVKRRRFGLGSLLGTRKSKPPAAEESGEDEEEPAGSEPAESFVADSDVNDQQDDSESAAPKKRRFGLGSMFKRRPAAENSPSEADSESPSEADSESPSETDSESPGEAESSQPSASEPPVHQAQSEQTQSDDGEQLSADEIDWNSLSKSERRRLKKQLKRQGRAA